VHAGLLLVQMQCDYFNANSLTTRLTESRAKQAFWMANSKGQSGFYDRLVAEFNALVWEMSRLYEKFRRLMEHLQDEDATASQPSPCNGCPKREKCTEPCELVKPQLPKEYGGKLHGEGTINLDLDKVRNGDSICDDLEKEDGDKFDRGNLKDMQKVTSVDLFSEYEACWSIFSKKQQQVLVLYHRDGKTITQIAKELHKWPSTVWGLLHRAEKRKQKDYGKQS